MPEDVRDIAGGEPTSLWYCATSYDDWLKFKELNGQNLAVRDMNEVMNAALRKHRHLLRNLDSYIWPADAPYFPWAASDMSELNPYLHDLQRNLLYRLAIAQSDTQDRTDIVVTDDSDTARVLQGSPPALSTVFSCLLGAVRARLAGLRTFLKRRRILKKLRRRYPLPQQLEQVDTLLIVWADSKTFRGSAPAEVHSALGVLPHVLAEAGHRVAYLVQLRSWVEEFATTAEKILETGAPVIFVEETWRFSEVLTSCFTYFGFCRNLIKKVSLQGIDVSGVIALAAFREMSTWRPIQAIQFRYLMHRLVPLGLKPHNIVYTYENQPWENVLLEGLRSNQFRDVNCVGVLHPAISMDSIRYFVSDRNIRKERIPDQLLVMGGAYRQWFLENGYPASRVQVGGTVRYQNIFDKIGDRNLSETAPNQRETFTLFCPMSVGVEESRELLRKVWLSTKLLPAIELRVVVNFHPSMSHDDREKITRAIPSDPGNVSFSELDTWSLLESADAVAYNTTGVAFEAICAGLPVFFVAQDTAADFDKVPEDLRVRCRTPSEIADAVARFAEQPLNSVDIKRRVQRLQDYMSPIDRTQILATMAV